MKAQYLLYVLLLSILIISCNDPVEPGSNGYYNKILFTSSRSGKKQLYCINPDGRGLKQITSGPYTHEWGRWAPSGALFSGPRYIACITNENMSTAGMNMVVVSVDGSERSLLPIGMQMSWSPDGKSLVFTFFPSLEIGEFTAYVCKINKDGTGFVQLTHNRYSWDGTPDWSPDGKKIAFASMRDYNGSEYYSEIYTMNADGSDQRRLTYTDNKTNANPSWSPDGEKIAFTSNGFLALMNSDGSDYKILDSLSTGGIISWSPDGSRIAFGAFTVYTVKANGSDLQKLITDPDIWGCDWAK